MTQQGGKAGGIDNIVAELLKADPEKSFQKLHQPHLGGGGDSKSVVKRVNREDPQKGDLKDCSNWRGITLLIVASKVLDQA